MAITTKDGLATAMAAATSQRRSWICDNTLGGNAASWYDHWFAAHLWGTAATPATGAGELLTSSSAGAIPLTNPAGGNTLYLAAMDWGSYIVGTVMVYDRLWQVGGLDQSVTTTNTINGATIARPDGNGYDVEVWVVAQDAGNSYTPTFTLHYKDHTGTDHNADTKMPSGTGAFSHQYAAFPLQLAAGDTSVQSVVSIKQDTGGTAGKLYGVMLLRRLATLDIKQVNYSYQKDGFQLAFPTVDSNACLAVMFANVGSASTLDGHLTLIEG